MKGHEQREPKIEQENSLFNRQASTCHKHDVEHAGTFTGENRPTWKRQNGTRE
jgi:hypothetical protein